ncbi:MAG: RAD55 family ATPase [Thermoplasmatota archaeon]
MTNGLVGFGIHDLDGLVGKGLRKGTVVNLTGPPGVGKTKISLSFLSEWLVSGETGLLVCFSSVPILNVLKRVRDVKRYAPLFETDEPVVMDLRDLDRVDILIGLIEDGGLHRLVLDHPEAMALRGSDKWFPMLEELLLTARSFGVTTLIVDYNDCSPGGIGRYTSDGIVSIDSLDGRIGARMIKWDLDPSLVGREAREEVPGAWSR